MTIFLKNLNIYIYFKQFKTQETEKFLDFFKYEIRKFCIAFSESLQKGKKQKNQ